MIVKNEQSTIQRLLSSVSGVFDEIVIVDTGSTDNTVNICAKYGRVYYYKWIDDFAAARNYAFSKATSQYIMWLDADDILSPQSIQQIKEWKQTATSPDTVMAKYIVAYDSNGNASYWYYRERIVKKCQLSVWRGKIHEAIAPFGKIEYANFVVEHKPQCAHTNRNLAIFRRMLAKGDKLDARLTFYYGRELYYGGYYAKAIKVLRHSIKMPNMWIEDAKQAHLTLAKIFVIKGEYKQAISQMLKAIQSIPITAEMCCALADAYMLDNQLQLAKQWYIFALNATQDTSGFVDEKYNLYYPAMQLVLVCHKLGEYNSSYNYHKLVADKYPTDCAVLYNQSYFDTHKELVKVIKTN